MMDYTGTPLPSSPVLALPTQKAQAPSSASQLNGFINLHATETMWASCAWCATSPFHRAQLSAGCSVVCLNSDLFVSLSYVTLSYQSLFLRTNLMLS